MIPNYLTQVVYQMNLQSINNKTVWIAVGASLAVILLISLVLGGSSTKIPEAANAVPSDAAVRLEIENPFELAKQILTNDNYKTISKLHFFNTLVENLTLLDSLGKTNPIIKQLRTKKMIVSAHNMGLRTTDFLYIITLSEDEMSEAMTELPNLTKKLGVTTEKDYDRAKIFTVTPTRSSNPQFYYSFYKSFFLLSKSEILIEHSVLSLNSDPISEPEYAQLYKAVDSDSPVKIFVNYANLPESVSTLLKLNMQKPVGLLSNFANVSVFNLNSEDKAFRLSGYTSAQANKHYFGIFNELEPAPLEIMELFPEKTAYFSIMSIGSGEDFYKFFSTYLTEIKEYNSFQNYIVKFKKTYEIRPEENLYKYFSTEAAYVVTDIRRNGREHNAYGIIKLSDENDINKFLDVLKAKQKTATEQKFKIDNTEYIYDKLPDAKLIPHMFGHIYSQFNAHFYTIIDDYMFFSETEEAMKTYLTSRFNKKTFKQDAQYEALEDNLSDEAHITVGLSTYGMNSVFTSFLDETEAAAAEKELTEWRKFYGPVFQYVAKDGPAYTSIYFEHQITSENETETVWELKTDSISDKKPAVVKNHLTEDKEIVIQDAKNKLYLIGNDGKILWEKPIDGKILSEIKQIDFFKNNKLQYVFNTATAIHIIDRLGNYVEGFPAKLPEKASTGMTVLDYDKNRDYRFAVPLADKSIFLTDATGKRLAGWNFSKTQYAVTKPIKHFASEGKDYLVFFDKSQVYITDRKGDTRVEPTTKFEIGQNSDIYFEPASGKNPARFVTTNPSGVVYFIETTGKIGKYTLEEFSEKHYFAYQDLDGDGLYEFIFADGNRIYSFNNKKEKIFSFSARGDISEMPEFYKFSAKDTKIGLHCGEKKLHYLIDNKGTKIDGFPVSGIGRFSITSFKDDVSFSMIANTPSGCLCKYDMKLK